MTEELVGYISGNRKREQIIQALSNGALEMSKIAKMARMPKRLAIKLLEDLERKELVKADGETYSLTETGIEIENRIRGM
ncbi:MAG: winged helix-turn-helix domain-containing protein [Methanosarcinales archaeon Met12]|nr:MAG: winged helix-turn-helix domain-containing protein [Methanosarcinales archaeon Met12]